MQTVAVIDYGSGNLRSVERALLEAAARANRRREIRVTRDPDFVRRCDRLVLPGQGAFADCRAGLYAIDGLMDAMTETARTRARPFLGICVGHQLLADRGLEFGEHPGTGWLSGVTRRLTPAAPDPRAPEHGRLKLPLMGWVPVAIRMHDHFLFSGLATGTVPPFFYFANSFAFFPDEATQIAATAHHGEEFPAAVIEGNLAGVQFHPEKSQDAGLGLLARFLDWRPT